MIITASIHALSSPRGRVLSPSSSVYLAVLGEVE